MKQIAKISGIAYLMIFVTGFYANFAVLENLIVRNNSLITTQNIINNHSQFGNGLFWFLVMLAFDLVLVWSLFILTKQINKRLSYLASFFRLLHAIFFSIALLKLIRIYQLKYNSSITIEFQDRVTELLLSFDTLWTIGLIVFGLHLIALGYLAIQSTFIPKALGVLLILAANGYIIDGLAKLFMSNYIDYKDTFEVIVIMPSVIGEFSFTIWLLIKGLNKDCFGKHNLKAV